MASYEQSLTKQNQGPHITSQVILTGSTNQLFVGSPSASLIFNYAQPIATRIVSIPDPLQNDSLVFLGASQTLSGKSFIAPQVQTSAAVTLTSAQSGDFITLEADTAAAYTITLPAAQAGLIYTVLVGHTLANAVTVAAPSAILNGTLLSADGTAVTGGAISGKTSITIGTTAVLGDSYVFRSDGTNWYVNGATGLHTSVTVNA